MPQPDPSELLPLKPAVFHILLALVPGDMHGYGIMQAVRAASAGHVHLKTGPFYRHLRWMLDADLVREVDRPDDADRRRGTHYGLTAPGRRVLDAESKRLSDLVGLTRRLGVIEGG